jgi:pimeloyl-ACP methyl ester carboxylesterase
MTALPTVRAARVAFDAAGIEDLRRRIAATRRVRFPLPGRWTYGTGIDVVRAALELWVQFDIDGLEARLNTVPQVDVELDGIAIRAFHVRGERDDALPIVLTHGWPSTILELLALAERLARPSAHGADPSDSFHVVVPALPGFPLSAAPAAIEDHTAARIADLWAGLMDALGYSRFAASAGDIGARITAWLGARHPERVVGIHVSSNALTDPTDEEGLTADEVAWLRRRTAWTRAEGAYMHVQRTKPLSLAHALTDSPAGLAAWILEKWHGWTPDADDVIDHFGAQELLGHLTLYWLTGSVATSLAHYWAYDLPPGPRPPDGGVPVPASFYLAPGENGGVPPRSIAERQHRVARWSRLPRGGHFVAAEEPDMLAGDIRAAFRETRSS